jgi:hypothetical protein
MDRGDKHSGRVDDEMAREVQGITQGQPGDGHIEDWRNMEPSGDDQPDVSLAPEIDPESAEDRAEIAEYLRRSIFPANPNGLLKEAMRNEAPDHVLDEIRQLDPNASFKSVAEIWSAMTGQPLREKRF